MAAGDQIKLLWLAVAALFLLNMGTSAYFLYVAKSQGDPHGHNEPRVEVPPRGFPKTGTA